MNGLDRRVQRLEAEAADAYWQRVAVVLTERVGHVVTADECRTLVDEMRQAAAPYLAQGLSPPATYAAALNVMEADVVAEAQAIANALGD
jgi:hypothetical protein